MASEFESLSKKYAVIFQQLGIGREDVVCFFVDIHKHPHIYPALAGLWILGAIGSLGSFHKWSKTTEIYQSEWAKGKEKYKSELELQSEQVSIHLHCIKLFHYLFIFFH